MKNYVSALMKAHYGLAIISGALIPLSLAPFNIWPLGFLSVSILVFLLHNPHTLKQYLLIGWLFGVGLFGVGTSWIYVSIHTFGPAPIALAIFLTALFVAGLALFTTLQCYLYIRFLKRHMLGMLLGFPALWVLSEWFRSWFLTGFPWIYLGYAHEHTWLSAWAPILGVYGVSFWVASGGVILYLCTRLSSQLRFVLLTLLLMPWVLGLCFQQIHWTTPTDKPISVALVQGDIAQELKWNESHMIANLQKQITLSNSYWQKDIVVWSETAIPFWYDEIPDILDNLNTNSKKNHNTLITGIPYREAQNDQTVYHNSVIALGDGSGIYHKTNLVPFGEYVPLEKWLRGLIAFFNLPMSSFTPGDNPVPYLTAQQSINIAPFICYEIVYPDYVARTLPKADILLTISNDTWFGESIGPLQHLQIAQMRALENGRYLLRATNNGITAIVNEHGQLISSLPQFESGVLTGDVYKMQGNTPFGHFGSYPILLFCTLLIGIAIFFKKPRKTK